MTPKRQHIAAILALASLIVPTWAATAAGASHDHAPSAPSTPPPATADDTKNTPSSTQPHTQSSGHLISPDNTTADNTTADNTTADNMSIPPLGGHLV